jgi:hypothetical protein
MLLRKIITSILLCCLLVQTMNQALVVVDYYANTESFAKDCINKARPQLLCNGKCQMMKKMEEQEKQANEALQKKVTLFEYSVPSERCELHNFPTALIRTFYTFKAAKPVRIPSDFFHPPGGANASLS